MPSFTDPPTGGKGPIRPPLRLVHPSTPKPPARPAAPHQNNVFTPDEERRLRAALKDARRIFGSWRAVCAALGGVPINTLSHAVRGPKRFSAALAVRLARALRTTVEALCAPPTTAGRCPTCGAARGAP